MKCIISKIYFFKLREFFSILRTGEFSFLELSIKYNKKLNTLHVFIMYRLGCRKKYFLSFTKEKNYNIRKWKIHFISHYDSNNQYSITWSLSLGWFKLLVNISAFSIFKNSLFIFWVWILHASGYCIAC